MTTKLTHDALRLLRDQLDPGVEMIFTPDAVEIEDIATLLQTHTLDYNRKVTILACCILIRLAVLRHLQLTLEDNALLTRGILDGDYLSGLLYRLASRRREWRLLQWLTPLQKRMQLALLRGRPADALFAEHRRHIADYLNQSCA